MFYNVREVLNTLIKDRIDRKSVKIFEVTYSSFSMQKILLYTVEAHIILIYDPKNIQHLKKIDNNNAVVTQNLIGKLFIRICQLFTKLKLRDIFDKISWFTLRLKHFHGYIYF